MALEQSCFLHFLPLMCRDGAKIQKFSEILTQEICFFSNFAILKVELNNRGGAIMKQTLESFEAMNLEYENLYNEDDERREYNSVWYS